MTSYCPTAANNCADKCWFCVPFVFQGVSNFCSDILFKLQNINVGNWRSLLLRRDSGDSINHLPVLKIITLATHLRTYHRFPVSVIVDDLYFKISWRVSTSLKARQFGRIQWDSLKKTRIGEISIFKLPHWTAKLKAEKTFRRGRRD